MDSATYPAWFDEVPRITMYDPLAELLGAARDGRIEYGYVDAVKLAGHSCPTVAGAYLMALEGLAALYDGRVPERGAIRVAFKEPRGEGVTGVIANVIGLITGAAGEEGFKGLGGRFGRNWLLSFGAQLPSEVRLATASDAVDVSFDPGPPAPELREALAAALRPDATPAARATLAAQFQGRARKILIEHRDDPTLVRVTRA